MRHMGQAAPESKDFRCRSAMREGVEGAEPLAGHRFGREQEAAGIGAGGDDRAMGIGPRQDGEHAAQTKGQQSSETLVTRCSCTKS